MKLKKIASLALAGIMAVSMLAGCKDNPSSSSEPTTPPETVTGAAAAINAELDENKDQISFENNSVVEDLLTNYYTNNPITVTEASSAGTVVNSGTTMKIGSDPMDSVIAVLNADAIGGFHTSSGGVRFSQNTDKTTNVEIYVLNAERLTEAGALKLVGQYIDDLVLPEEGTAGAANKDYSYTGSVAAVEAHTDGDTASAWVIAVTITQTPSNK